MSSSSIEKPTKIYDDKLYEAAAKGSTFHTDPRINIEATNVVMQILKEKIINALPESREIERQLDAGKIDTKTARKIEEIFRAIGFNPDTTERSLLDEERKDLALRTANLLKFKFLAQASLLVSYLCSSKGLPKTEAVKLILSTKFSNSLGDAVGCRIIAIWERDIAAAEERSRVAEQEIEVAKKRRKDAEMMTDAIRSLRTIAAEIKRR